MTRASIFLTLALAVTGPAESKVLDACVSVTAVVVERNAVQLQCSKDWPVTPQFAELWRVPLDWNKDPRQRGTQLAGWRLCKRHQPSDASYRVLRFSKELEPGVGYFLLLRAPGEPLEETPMKVIFSTGPEAIVERDKISGIGAKSSKSDHRLQSRHPCLAPRAVSFFKSWMVTPSCIQPAL